MRTPMHQQGAGTLTVTNDHQPSNHLNGQNPSNVATNIRGVLSLVSSDLFELANCKWLIAVVLERGKLLPVSILGQPPALEETLAELKFLVSCSSGAKVDGPVCSQSTAVTFPVIVSGQTVGAIALGPGSMQSEADVRLISETSNQIAALLANDRLAARVVNHARLFQQTRQQLKLAREVQSRLLPSQLPAVRGLDYYGDSRPAGEVGGDFFDFVPLAGGDLGVLVGDVSGKGIPAAIVMAGIQISFRGLARDHTRHVAALLKEVNRLVYEVSPPNFYATMFYAEVNPESGRLTYVNAGHEPPLLVRKRGGSVERLRTGGTVVGLTTRTHYEVGTAFLDPGDVLVAFTDGVTDALSNEGVELREAGVVEAVRSRREARAIEVVEAILETVDRFTGTAAPADDRTAVVLRMTEAAQRSSLETAAHFAMEGQLAEELAVA